MQTIYVLICSDRLYLYEKNEHGFERLYLNGCSEYFYEFSKAKSHIQKMMELIADEYNLTDSRELDLVLIDHHEKLVSDIIANALGDGVRKRHGLAGLIRAVLDKLEQKPELLISEHGINFDGKCYVRQNENIAKREFQLLAYTLPADELISYLN